MFEGIPTFPDTSRFWNVIDKYQVNIFYTAPTAIRALMAHGNAPLKSSSRDSLKVLGTVGEPINPEAWEWYYHCLLYTSPSPRDLTTSRMPSSA